VEEAEVVTSTTGERIKVLLCNWKFWATLVSVVVVVVLIRILSSATKTSSLGEAVDLFRCCIFTWNALAIVLPAFLIAGAIVTFLPTQAVMKYLGAKANRLVSYGVSSISGNILTVCSCNVVPIFAGILRRGAGIGPAFCFVFAAPAIHLVNTIFTYQVIGLKLALWRMIAVPIIAIIVGALMAVIFRREEHERQKDLKEKQIALVETPGQTRKGAMLIAGLAAIMIFGAWLQFDKLFVNAAVGQFIRLGGVIVALIAAVSLAYTWFGKEDTAEWGRQSYSLVKMIVPITIPAILLIAFIVGQIPIRWIAPTGAELAAQGGFTFGHPAGNSFLPVLSATIFGTLMYFPALTEVAFTKGLLLKSFATGPALAILLGGPGLSLPGLILVGRIAGWKKTLVYWLLCIILITLVAWSYGSTYGKYDCICQNSRPAH
jgi:uncharacterized protein